MPEFAAASGGHPQAIPSSMVIGSPSRRDGMSSSELER
jgi:hypothetical protein